MNNITNYNHTIFESIKNIDEDGDEFWYARDLQQVLEYKQWRRFSEVIDRAKISCETIGNTTFEHFVDVGKTSSMPNGGVKEIGDIKLTRYACYLIVQNGDPRKQVIALGQTYFAVKTRQQELAEERDSLEDDSKRLAIRNEMKTHNKKLVNAANDAGVKTNQEYATFQNHGYKGLYGGMTAKDIHAKKGLKKSQQILDHMDSTELAANLFRATQTEDKLRRENIKGKHKANAAHLEVGEKVRQTIADLGGTMPEDLPTPEKSIKQIERKLLKESKK